MLGSHLPSKAQALTNHFFFRFVVVFMFSLSIFGCSSGSLSTQVDSSKIIETHPSVSYSASTFGLYDIASFDVFAENNAVHILIAGKSSALDKQNKLRYLRSDDSGNTWQEPVSLGDLPETMASRGNDVQIAVSGERLLAVWQTKGELPSMGPMVSAYSDDNGRTWQRGANPAGNDAGDQSHFDVIADQRGHFHVAWLEDPEENGYQSLRYNRTENSGKSWDKAQTLDNSTCSCCWNTLALSPDNALNILYRDMKPRDMALIQSNDSGLTWQPASTVGEFGWQFDGCPHDGGSLAYPGSRNPKQMHGLVWTGLEQKAGLYYLLSNDNGKTWSTPQRLGNTAIHGDIAVDDGEIMTAWDEMESEGSAIFYAKTRSGENPKFTPIRLTQASNAATHPRLVATKHGFLALWTEKPGKQPSRLAWQSLH